MATIVHLSLYLPPMLFALVNMRTDYMTKLSLDKDYPCFINHVVLKALLLRNVHQ